MCMEREVWGYQSSFPDTAEKVVNHIQMARESLHCYMRLRLLNIAGLKLARPVISLPVIKLLMS